MLKSPTPWYGGKYYIRKYIYPYFEIPHQTFVDVFGGGGSIILGKKPSPVDVYNDIDENVVNLFRVLRDKPDELISLLELTPVSRTEFYDCKETYTEGSDVERARKFFTIIRQGFASSISGGWGLKVTESGRGMSSQNAKFISGIEYLPEVVGRLREIQIENSDFEKIFKIYDRPTTLFYLDPPYLHETRQSKGDYTNEMSIDDHQRLLDLVVGVKGHVVLSGYNNELYNDKLKYWRKVEFEVATSASKSDTRKGKSRVEVLWINQ